MARPSDLANFFLSKKQDYKDVFSGRAGRRVLNDLLKECQLDRNPIVPGDEMTSFTNIGRQLVGRVIQNNLHLPDSEIIRRANQLKPENTDGTKIEEEDNV